MASCIDLPASGALAAGMDAAIVLWKGRPISTWAETKRVIVGGKTVFER